MTTPDTEGKKVQWREVPKQVGVTLNIGDKYTYVETRLSPEEMQGIKELIEYSLTSRDTYWKEKYEPFVDFAKSFEKKADDAWKPMRVFRSDGQVEKDEAVKDVMDELWDEAKDLLDNLK